MTAILSNKIIVGPWVARRTGVDWNPACAEAIGLVRRDEMVAGVIYTGWNRASFTCHIAVDGLMTPAYLRAIFHYPFEHCGARKIIAPIVESNRRSIRFVEKLGFRKEAQLLDAHPEGSILLYTMSRDQCRFLGECHGQRPRQKYIAPASA